MSDNVDPLSILTDDAEIAMWNNYGLPSDRMSSENATILVNSQRWPLMIDPQVSNICNRNIYLSFYPILTYDFKFYSCKD